MLKRLMVIFKGLLFLITLLICRNSAKRVQRILINPEQVSAVISILQHQGSCVTIPEECWYIITNWSPHYINISVTFAWCLFFFFDPSLDSQGPHHICASHFITLFWTMSFMHYPCYWWPQRFWVLLNAPLFGLCHFSHDEIGVMGFW